MDSAWQAKSSSRTVAVAVASSLISRVKLELQKYAKIYTQKYAGNMDKYANQKYAYTMQIYAKFGNMQKYASICKI